MKKLSELIKDIQHIRSLRAANFENPTILDMIEANNLDVDVLSDFDIKRLENFLWNNINRNYDIFHENYVYESLNHSYDTDELIDKIHTKFEDKLAYLSIKVETDSTTKSFSIFAKDKQLENDEDFKSLLNFYNYFVSDTSDEDGYRSLYIEPYKPEERTDYIYNKCDGIIYRAVDKGTLDKVLKVGLIAHHDKGHNRFHPRYTYCVASNNKEELKKIIPMIGFDIKQKDLHLLKIDLKKYKNKVRFFVDPASVNYPAYFTREYIPRYCCEEITLKEI